jgi:GAF domain-containing protein
MFGRRRELPLPPPTGERTEEVIATMRDLVNQLAQAVEAAEHTQEGEGDA